MILLTDEEMQLAIGNAISNWAMDGYNEGWGDDAMAQDNYKVIRKAQLKKVVEEIGRLDDGVRSSASWRSEVRKLRQALLKEIE